MNTLLEDVRFCLRVLAKSPGFAAVAILTLALGIGANTAIFSVVYAALLRPLPYSQPDRLLTLTETRGAQDNYWDCSYPDYLDWQKQSTTFQSFAGVSNDGWLFHGSGEPQQLFGAQVTTNFFSVLGVKPVLGRDFGAGEDIASGPRVALLTYNFWQKQFAGDSHVVGRSMQLDDKSVTIIGVLPREFEFAPTGQTDVWVPMHLSDQDMAARRSLRWMHAIGRLAPGATPAKARVEMDAINARLAAAYPQANAAIHVRIVPLRERIVGQVQPLLWVLFGAVGFVLLIACANVANLLMVRAVGRRREFAIRTALGASRGRLISQLLTESLLLAFAGAALAFFVAQWCTAALIAAIPQQILYFMPFLRDTRPNAAILVFLCAVAVLTGVLFGLAPALQVSHAKVGDALKEESRTSAGGVHTRLLDAVVVIEIAVSLILLVGAGLTVKSLSALLRRNPGFDTHNLLTFAVNLPDSSYPKDPDQIRFDKTFSSRASALPGILGVANTSVVPLSGGGNSIRFVIQGQPVATGKESESSIREVSDNYFSVLRIPLKAGRYFDEADDSATASKHIIVNEAWVREYLHGENPIGKQVKFTFSSAQPYREIVGVVGNIADAQLDSPEEPALFLPFAQDANSYINYIVRTRGNPLVSLSPIRDALSKIDSRLAPILPVSMDQIIQRSPAVFLRRYPSYLIGSFAALALLLAMIGLYGLISYSLSQRTREIGLRVALGAQYGDVMRLVLGQGAKLTAIGLVVGIGAALGLTQLMGTILYGVKAIDPLTFILVAMVLALLALAASYLPARRATRVDPLVTLRYE
jgi:putative ABC transport system permease protein